MQHLRLSKSIRDKLKQSGIETTWDLITHLPLRYENRTHISAISELKPGVAALIEGVVVLNEVIHRPRRTLVIRVNSDGEELFLRFLNFYPSQQKQLAIGRKFRVYGEPRQGYYGMEMIHPKCQAIEDNTLLETTLTPVYPLLHGVQNRSLKRLIKNEMETLVWPEELSRICQDLPDDWPRLKDSFGLLHSPPLTIESKLLDERKHPAWDRIKFDELLAHQISMRRLVRKRSKEKGIPLPLDEAIIAALQKNTGFALTSSQIKVIKEIALDFVSSYPMRRLLQGDVGSGKTVVAALAALGAVRGGCQAAFLSPTEILAEQHYLKLREWFSSEDINIDWLAASLPAKEKVRAIERVATGETKIIVGTHALIQEQVRFDRLALVVVDEQHKFGVSQRLAMQNKGQLPHLLMMSATPIPRTLAMSYFADLDVSVIDELPPGRMPIKTRLINAGRREEIVERVRAAGREGRQIYWVCPLIEESGVLQLQTAEDTFVWLQQEIPELPIGLIHGRMSRQEKALAMEKFKKGHIAVLVATTVIEVGVDVPRASLMIIENAERMGLAQLHQLRGRVGRGNSESTCVLMYQEPLTDEAKRRLKIIFENTDGFEIARQDLIMRGPGELMGAAQSGMPMMRFADPEKDAHLLDLARRVANELLETQPDVAEATMQRWLGKRQDFLHV